MDTKYNSLTDNFSAIKGDRNFGGLYNQDYNREESVDSKSVARNILGIDRVFQEAEDNRDDARKTLYAGRIEPIQEEVSTQTEAYQEATHLYIGEAFGESAFAKKGSGSELDMANLMPSSATMQYAQYDTVENFLQPDAAPVAAVAAKTTPLTKKQKVSVAIYSAMVGVVALLIIVTGAMIGAVTKNKKVNASASNASQETLKSTDKAQNNFVVSDDFSTVTVFQAD